MKPRAKSYSTILIKKKIVLLNTKPDEYIHIFERAMFLHPNQMISYRQTYVAVMTVSLSSAMIHMKNTYKDNNSHYSVKKSYIVQAVITLMLVPMKSACI